MSGLVGLAAVGVALCLGTGDCQCRPLDIPDMQPP